MDFCQETQLETWSVFSILNSFIALFFYIAWPISFLGYFFVLTYRFYFKSLYSNKLSNNEKQQFIYWINWTCETVWTWIHIHWQLEIYRRRRSDKRFIILYNTKEWRNRTGQKNTRPEGKCFISIPRERFLISDVFNLVGLFFFKKIKKEII